MILHHEFIKTAKRQRGKLAFIDRSTGKRMSYRDTLVGAFILSQFIRAIDEQYIGIMLPTSAGCGLSVLATLFAGKVPVMINYSTGAAQNILYARDKCGFGTVVTSRTVLKKVGCQEMPGMIFMEDWLKQISTGNKIRTALMTKLPSATLIKKTYQARPDDTAVIIFTSGSEKEPKGVELTHKSIGANIDGMMQLFKLDDHHVQLAILPQFHVFGFTTNLWLPLHVGMRIVTYGNPLEAKNIAQIIREEKPTLFIGTPFFLMSYERFARAGDFSSLELVVAGADKTPDWLFEAYEKNHGIRIIEGYGATETSPVISVNPPGAIRRGSIGKPLPGVAVKITDIDSGEELPPGREGKILVKGDILMKGYFGDIEETTLKIEDGWYETGDMGVLDEDGYLWHRGRLRRFVKIGGEMVSLVNVESTLEHILPEGVECCAVDVPDARRGTIIAVATSQNIDTTAIKKKLGDKLPPIALPKHFVTLTEMPKMGNGKVDFRTTTDKVREVLKTTPSTTRIQGISKKPFG